MMHILDQDLDDKVSRQEWGAYLSAKKMEKGDRKFTNFLNYLQAETNRKLGKPTGPCGRNPCICMPKGLRGALAADVKRVQSGKSSAAESSEEEEIEVQAAMFMCDDYQSRADFEAYRGLLWGPDGAIQIAGAKDRVASHRWASAPAERHEYCVACVEETKQRALALQPSSSILEWRIELEEGTSWNPSRAAGGGEEIAGDGWAARVNYSRRLLLVSRAYLEDKGTTAEDVADTVTHEAAHILVHGASGVHCPESHTQEWRDFYRELGGERLPSP